MNKKTKRRKNLVAFLLVLLVHMKLGRSLRLNERGSGSLSVDYELKVHLHLIQMFPERNLFPLK